MLPFKQISELKAENQELYETIFKLEDENADLKSQLKASDMIIGEYEGRVLQLKAQVKELMRKTSNNVVLDSAEINIRPPLVHNERGAGRKSRVDEKTLELIISLKNQGLSHQKIAEKLTEATGEQWSKSTVGYILAKNTEQM